MSERVNLYGYCTHDYVYLSETLRGSTRTFSFEMFEASLTPWRPAVIGSPCRSERRRRRRADGRTRRERRYDECEPGKDVTLSYDLITLS